MRRVVIAVATMGSWACAHRLSSSPPVLTEARCAETGAVTTVCPRDTPGMAVFHVEQLVEGRVAGVRVVRPSRGGISLRIWGPSTIVGDNEPLYVLDGVPLHISPGRGLDWLNPGDIARIEILKDVAATAAYGIRGANGVVLITTRRGQTRPD